MDPKATATELFDEISALVKAHMKKHVRAKFLKMSFLGGFVETKTLPGWFHILICHVTGRYRLCSMFAHVERI